MTVPYSAKQPNHKPGDYLGALHDNLTPDGKLVRVTKLPKRTNRTFRPQVDCVECGFSHEPPAHPIEASS